MQSTQRTISLSLKSLYFGGGSTVILILEVLLLMYGFSDGSLLYVAPLLISPILGVIGVVLGIIAIKRKSQLRQLAVLGIIFGCLCVLLFVGLATFAIALASALQGMP
jgi:cytochrome bd-type quinol oxidase subunit 2